MRGLCWRLGDKPLILLALRRDDLVNNSDRRGDPSRSRRAAEPPSRRAAEPPSRRAAEPLHMCGHKDMYI